MRSQPPDRRRRLAAVPLRGARAPTCGVPLRAGATRDELQRLIEAVWSVRADRGAEERLGMDRETTLIPVRSLKKDAHLEMHTRGG